MSSNTKSIPTRPMIGGNVNQLSEKERDEYFRYKAYKYHMKCQHKLKEFQTQGKSIPTGFESYLQPFQG